MSLIDSIVKVEKMIKNNESLKEKLLKTVEQESAENIVFLFSLCDISLFTPIHDDETNSIADNRFSNIYMLHQILSKGDCELFRLLIKKEKRFKQKLTSFINKNLINIDTIAMYASNTDIFEICLHNISRAKLKHVFIKLFSNKKTNVASGSHYCNLSLLIKYAIDNKVINEEDMTGIFKNTVDADMTVLDLFFTYSNDKQKVLFNGLEKFIKKEYSKTLFNGHIPPSQYDMLKEKEEISILKTWLEHLSTKDFKKIYNDKGDITLYDIINNNLTNTPLYNIILNNSLYFNVAKTKINSNVKIIMKNNRI